MLVVPARGAISEQEMGRTRLSEVMVWRYLVDWEVPKPLTATG